MKQVLFVMLLALARALPTLEAQTPSDTSGEAEAEQLRQQIRQRWNARVRQELNLSDDQAAKLQGTEQKFTQQRVDLALPLREIHALLRELLFRPLELRGLVVRQVELLAHARVPALSDLLPQLLRLRLAARVARGLRLERGQRAREREQHDEQDLFHGSALQCAQQRVQFDCVQALEPRVEHAGALVGEWLLERADRLAQLVGREVGQVLPQRCDQRRGAGLPQESPRHEAHPRQQS